MLVRKKLSARVLRSLKRGAFRNISLTQQALGICHISSGRLKPVASLNIFSAVSTRLTSHLSSGRSKLDAPLNMPLISLTPPVRHELSG